jgi:hypothetical protein
MSANIKSYRIIFCQKTNKYYVNFLVETPFSSILSCLFSKKPSFKWVGLANIGLRPLDYEFGLKAFDTKKEALERIAFIKRIHGGTKLKMSDTEIVEAGNL